MVNGKRSVAGAWLSRWALCPISLYVYVLRSLTLCGLLAMKKQLRPIELFGCFILENDDTVSLVSTVTPTIAFNSEHIERVKI